MMFFSYTPEPAGLSAARAEERAAHDAFALAHIVAHYDDARRAGMDAEAAAKYPARFAPKGSK